jgi:Tfp pilus assembly protein PilO
MYANHRHYILFTLALITFIVASLGFGLLHDRVYKQSIQAGELMKEVKSLEDQKSHELEVKNAYSKIKEQRDRLNSFIVSKDKIVDFIEEVEKIGTQTSTDIEFSNPVTKEIVKGKKIEDNFTTMTARIDVEGTWPNMMRALTLIENLPYSLSLNNIRINVEKSTETAEDPAKLASSTPKTPIKAKIWTMVMDVKVLILDNS